MGKNPSVASRKLILQTAIQKRTCPPDEVLLQHPGDQAVRQHVAGCTFCRERLQMAEECPAVQRLAQALAPDRTSRPPQEPAPGQIWSLKPSLSGWGPENAYYNPPLVLILSLISDPLPAVRVCQLCHEFDLAGPGDVPLSEEHGVAQAWNAYSLAAADLDAYRGTIADQLLLMVLDQSNQSHPDPDPHTVLQAFRELEIKVGSVMAARSVLPVLESASPGQETPTTLQRLAARDAQGLRAYLRTAYPDLHPPEDPGLSASAVLGLAEWVDLPLAASDTQTLITMTCAWFDSDHKLHLSPAQAEITLTDISESGLFVTGRFLDPAVHPEHLCAWWVEGTWALDADRAGISPDGTYFQLDFHLAARSSQPSGTLKLLLLGHA